MPRSLTLPAGTGVPALGLGTWNMGDGNRPEAEEVEALRLGVDLGIGLLDTAEMYGGGRSEALVGRAIEGLRDDVVLVSKVLPSNAGRDGVLAACEASLGRLGTDHLDLYLLHWRGPTPLEETVGAFEELRADGLIRGWGVSNFDPGDMAELAGVPGGEHVQTNQVLFNLTRRGIEWDLLPELQERRIPVMAYSPIEQGRILGHPELEAVAARHGATQAQVALAWVLAFPGVLPIPQTGSLEHVRENRAALDLELTPEDRAQLDRAFPPPAGPRALELL